MHYLFVFLVALNASYFGYQVLKETEPSALQPLANVTQKDFPVTLRLVSQQTILEQLSNMTAKLSAEKVTAS
ncbi:MAG: hypothetical protein H7Z73_08295 [Candidatus Saccharibacteria bacterium]|nr:hypothetical protein [Moraxellaceae bacterium]